MYLCRRRVVLEWTKMGADHGAGRERKEERRCNIIWLFHHRVVQSGQSGDRSRADGWLSTCPYFCRLSFFQSQSLFHSLCIRFIFDILREHVLTNHMTALPWLAGTSICWFVCSYAVCEEMALIWIFHFIECPEPRKQRNTACFKCGEEGLVFLLVSSTCSYPDGLL